MSIPFKVVIPARYGSTRLPGKPLLEIAGQPMIAHVCQRALAADAEQVVVATDDLRIVEVVEALGFEVLMTDPNHQSGTERINQVAQQLNWTDDDIVVNLQGDEPLISTDSIQAVANALANQKKAGIATLAAKITESAEVFNPHAVKVVVNHAGYALYFSRAAIPWDRENFSSTGGILSEQMPYLRHIGLYAYTVEFLNHYCSWQNSTLEKIESLEQLRILWYGEPILVKIVDQAPEAGVDTMDDLARVIKRLSNAD